MQANIQNSDTEYILHKYYHADGSITTKMIPKPKPKPNILQNLANTAVDLVQGGFADSDTAKARLAVCMECPDLRNGTHCKLCGCYMEAKTKVALAQCPAGKWPDSQRQTPGQLAHVHMNSGAERIDK